jgi:lambda repressor-like predicted transcriptional regulator
MIMRKMPRGGTVISYIMVICGKKTGNTPFISLLFPLVFTLFYPVLCVNKIINQMRNNIDKHYGEIIERTIRRNGYSISELSRLMKVNRRSIYNWFNQAKFKSEIIFKIGCALKHDFSNEFPELFSPADFQQAFSKSRSFSDDFLASELEKINYWKDKYISLLEEYNEILAIKGKDAPTSAYMSLKQL